MVPFLPLLVWAIQALSSMVFPQVLFINDSLLESCAKSIEKRSLQ